MLELKSDSRFLKTIRALSRMAGDVSIFLLKLSIFLTLLSGAILILYSLVSIFGKHPLIGALIFGTYLAFLIGRLIIFFVKEIIFSVKTWFRRHYY